MDFAQNFIHKYQDKPQSVHWHHQQTAMHPIVNYYRCDKTNKIITDEHMILTNDLKHDKFAVEEFQKVSLKYLSKQGFKPNKIIQFCDNCSGQYKVKGLLN